MLQNDCSSFTSFTVPCMVALPSGTDRQILLGWGLRGKTGDVKIIIKTIAFLFFSHYEKIYIFRMGCSNILLLSRALKPETEAHGLGEERCKISPRI